MIIFIKLFIFVFRRNATHANGSARRPSPISAPIPAGPLGTAGRPVSLMDNPSPQYHINRVVVVRDEKGYGMKVSGDNPVYVQSVKPGKI